MVKLPDSTTYLDPLCAPFLYGSDSEDAVVLVHGWTGSPAHMRMLGDVLAKAGYVVAAPLLPGHGTEVAEMLQFDWRDWVREVALTSQDQLDAGRRVHLVGLSLGAALCLLVAPSLGASSLSVISPAIRTRSRRMWMTPLFRRSDRVNQDEPDPPDDPEAARYYLGYTARPVGSYADLNDAMRAARKNLAAVTCPLLVIQSVKDETIRPESGQLVYDGVSSQDKQLIWLRRSRHNAMIDRERHIIHEAVLERISTAT